MSFFKEFKDDLSQAVTELIPENEVLESNNNSNMVSTLEEVGDADSVDIAADQDELEDNFNDNVDQDLLKALFDEEYDDDDISLSEVELSESFLEDIKNNQDKVNYGQDSLKTKNKDYEGKNEVTVITKGTIIEGSITSDGSLEVMGTIHGDIDCLGKLTIIGEVIGNSIASEIYVNTKKLVGSISSEGSVKISDGTVVIGDITASSGVIAGAVKGEIDINGPIVVDSSAIIKGNINAKSVQINNGAVMDGFCSLSYSDIDIESVFE